MDIYFNPPLALLSSFTVRYYTSTTDLCQALVYSHLFCAAPIEPGQMVHQGSLSMRSVGCDGLYNFRRASSLAPTSIARVTATKHSDHRNCCPAITVCTIRYGLALVAFLVVRLVPKSSATPGAHLNPCSILSANIVTRLRLSPPRCLQPRRLADTRPRHSDDAQLHLPTPRTQCLRSFAITVSSCGPQQVESVSLTKGSL